MGSCLIFLISSQTWLYIYLSIYFKTIFFIKKKLRTVDMNLKNPPEHYGTFNNHPTKGG
jgi:hypothetical protein